MPLASRLAAAAAAVVLSLAPPPAAAISENQLLFLEAWRAVDRAYVDKTFAGQPWFRARSRTLARRPPRLSPAPASRAATQR